MHNTVFRVAYLFCPFSFLSFSFLLFSLASSSAWSELRGETAFPRIDQSWLIHRGDYQVVLLGGLLKRDTQYGSIIITFLSEQSVF